MKNFTKIILFSSVSLLAVNTVFAANALTSGFYAQADIGRGKVDVDGGNLGRNGVSLDKEGLMGDINFGYKMSQNFALETGFAKFADVKTSAPSEISRFFSDRATTQNYYLDVAFKGIMPFDSGLDIFAKVGPAIAHTNWNTLFGYNQSNQDYFKLVGYCGLGADYFFTPNLGLTFQYTTTTKSGSEVPAMYAGTLGITYIFNNSET